MYINICGRGAQTLSQSPCAGVINIMWAWLVGDALLNVLSTCSAFVSCMLLLWLTLPDKTAAAAVQDRKRLAQKKETLTSAVVERASSQWICVLDKSPVEKFHIPRRLAKNLCQRSLVESATFKLTPASLQCTVNVGER